ncbi:uncharacterized protein KIAA2012 homolog [Embiotoca jacksoni]|uniref:uncharacterized protein KIAA2012 homolog n=1 Tax=Embiotoca jacksoni TaxID=100190 RepID=UPI003703BF52
MKDMSLSLLSRGWGRLVSSGRDTGRRDGRLDVCFTPQDYYIWKSKESLLRLSHSGRLLVEAEATLPKTYSTRRGPLLLYSQDLVTLESRSHPKTRDEKQRVVRRQTRQVEQQLSTVKDLTAAILKYSNNQFSSSRPAPPLLPPLHLPPAPDPQRPGPELSVHLNSPLLPAERNSEEPENHLEDEDGEHSSRRVRLDLFLHVPTPPTEPRPREYRAALTPEERRRPVVTRERLQAHLEASPRHAEIDRHGTGVKLRHLNRNCVGDAAGGGGSSDRRGRTGSFLPPLEVCPGSSWEDTDQVGHEVLGGSDQRPLPAAESRTVVSRQEVQPEAGRAGLHQQPQCLPLLFPWMEESPPPPAGVLAGVAGRRGLGRLSSVAFLQDRLLYLQDPHESSGANRGVIRGVLPLELRDLVGSLILGPDGEVIQLSLYDNKQHPSHTGGDTQRKAVRVLSAEGEELPWVIVLQPENTHTEGGAEPSTDAPEGDDQHHRSGHRLLHLSQPPARSPSSHTGTATVTEKHTKKETRWTPKKDAKLNVRLPPLMEQGGKEQRGGEEEQDEEVEEEEEDQEEEEQLATQQLSGSLVPHQQNVNTTEAAAEESVDESRRRRTVRTVAAATAGERNMTTGNRAESDGQKTSRMRREARWKGQKTGSADPPISSQKPEERTDGQRAETLPFVRKKRGGVKKSEDEEERGEGAWQREESAGRRRREKLKHKEFTDVNPEGLLEEEEAEEESHFKSTKSSSEEHQNKTRTNSKKDAKHLPTNDNVPQADEPSSVQSESSLRSSSRFNRGGSRRSAASSCERSTAAVGLASSRGRLSSCSVVMAADEQLKLNPVKLESSRRSQKEEEDEEEEEEEEEEMEMERRRRSEREEEERKKQREKEQTEERMRRELEEERRKRSEELRLKRLAEEDERRGREEEEQRETRRKEERRRQTERRQRRREEEEQRRRAEKERLQLEETRRQEAESRMLQEMDESERREYLRRKEQEEEDRRSEEERRRRRDEEARLQAELLSRQVALLQQRLAFKRGLSLEAGGLEKTQGISRPWISSYFTLLQLLGVNKAQSSAAEP